MVDKYFHNIRPAFLEPEVSNSHFPNKSALIGTYSNKRSFKNHSEPYRFPLFRTKQFHGFKLSISPEGKDNIRDFLSVKTPASSVEAKRNPSVPFSAAYKVRYGKRTRPYGLN